MVVIEPAGLEDFFRAFGEPATSLEWPAEGAISPPPDSNRFAELARKLELSFPSGAELREQLPSFAGQSPV
ncbi:hypothetical protein [Bradyrhizobium sp. AZCC 1678]|uniref:hypothetical protein n=1 Tax=Bradyrhizobium sp. AZCC 1678 TaxID=3117030 RepID=UPI002FEFF0B5